MQEIEAEVMLSHEQRLVFMEVIEESLRITQRTHLFNWLQRGLQYLVGHEVMIFGIKSSDNDLYVYEYFTSSRYFSEEKFNLMLKENSVIRQAKTVWRRTGVPTFVSLAHEEKHLTHYSSIHLPAQEIADSELKEFVLHGFGDSRSRVSTFVVFGRLSSTISAQTAFLLELIMPHLHCALVKVTTSPHSEGVVLNNAQLTKKVTKREVEILHWLHLGKTNWEISNILKISPLTVKNHVQNIIRKLNVENRGQAAAKAAQLGLVAVKV